MDERLPLRCVCAIVDECHTQRFEWRDSNRVDHDEYLIVLSMAV